MKKSEKGQAMLEAWRQSGLTRREFCIQHNVSYSTFNYWCRRLSADAPAGFTEIEVKSKSPATLGIGLEVVFPSGVKLVFGKEPCASWLKNLVS